MYDMIIVGAGPAGLTAAIYARRADKSVLVLEKGMFGGQMTFSPKIENYPGYNQISGNELAEKLVDQAITLGAEIDMQEVTGVRKEENGVFIVTCEECEFMAHSVIIATGSRHRMLGLSREERFVGDGISFCAVCDGAFYAGKTVAVIGGGNSALQEAIMLSDGCEKVYVVQNLDFLTGEEKLAAILRERENVEFVFGCVVDEILGDDVFGGIVIRNEHSGEKIRLDLDGMFVAIGQVPENEPFKNVAELSDRGYVVSDEDCLTGTEGLFVAGDCRTKKIRQITTACGDGAVAALAACRYLDK
ncbi:MAG: FAD-dependent oxidoreductase [Clostridia bacterium]|nr:FAD-dependent oxidoreductase [Clostridia bacterium]